MSSFFKRITIRWELVWFFVCFFKGRKTNLASSESQKDGPQIESFVCSDQRHSGEPLKDEFRRLMSRYLWMACSFELQVKAS